MIDDATRSRIVDHNLRLHEAPGYAEQYDEKCGIVAHPWERRVFDRDVEHIVQVLGTPEGKRVLDVGCGTGSLSLLFLERGFRVVGLDLSAAMLRELRDKAAEHGLSDQLATAEAEAGEYLTTCNGRFDAVVFSAVLHHLPDYLEIVRLAAARVKVGGLVYIVHEPSLAKRVGTVARCLEALDRSLEEFPGFVRRQIRDARQQGLIACVKGKLGRRLVGRAPQGPATGEGGAEGGASAKESVDWALVDFHSKHGGCDEQAVAAFLREAGFRVDLQRYDSKRHRVLHLLARVLSTKRMIRIMAVRER